MDNGIKTKVRNVLIVPVGLEKDRVLEGCEIYPINVVYLLINPDSSPEKLKIPVPEVTIQSRKFADSVYENISHTLRNIQKMDVKLNSFNDCVLNLNKIFQKESHELHLNKIYINISTASKSFAIAAYVFACYHPEICTVFYLRTNNYTLLNQIDNKQEKWILEFFTHGLTSGPYELEEIPLLRVKIYNAEEKALINVLKEYKNFNSIKEIMLKLNISIDPKHRIRLKRQLEQFARLNFINLKKDGKEVKIIATDHLITLGNILG